jgi:hypothetical protein
LTVALSFYIDFGSVEPAHFYHVQAARDLDCPLLLHDRSTNPTASLHNGKLKLLLADRLGRLQ